MGKTRLAVIGCGMLGNILVDAYNQGLLEDYEIVAVLGRTPEKAQALAEKANCAVSGDINELLSFKPDYVAEMASVESVRDNAIPILRSGANFVVLSIGAFADKDFYEEVAATAKEHNAKVHIASGAVGGFDVLRTISLMGCSRAYMEGHKNPKALQNTPLFTEDLMTTEDAVAFEGTAKEAIAFLPTKVNVSIATALATVGPENLQFSITSTPGFVGDDHHIVAEGPGVKADLDIYSSTAEIAAYSVVAVLQNVASPVMF